MKVTRRDALGAVVAPFLLAITGTAQATQNSRPDVLRISGQHARGLEKRERVKAS